MTVFIKRLATLAAVGSVAGTAMVFVGQYPVRHPGLLIWLSFVSAVLVIQAVVIGRRLPES